MIEKITSLQHPLVKQLTKLRKERKERYAAKEVVVLGKKIVREVRPHTILAVDTTPYANSESRVIAVTPEVIKKIAGTENPEEVLGVAALPASVNLSGVSRLLVLDNLRDPGNMGTLIRTALALGWDGVYITEQSVDPYNDKALRAAKGATFRIPIQQGSREALEKLIITHQFCGCIADMGGEPPQHVQQHKKLALILSNESHGMRPIEGQKIVSVPMDGEMESLNGAVAGGILMHLMGQGSGDE